MTSDLKIYPGITQLSQKYEGILLDAYGVFWGGNEFGVLPDTKDTMEKLVKSGKIVGILSNTTQLASKEINKLQLKGISQGTHFHFLITSGEVARYIFIHEKLPFETPRNTFWVFGGDHPKHSPPPHEAIFKESPYIQISNIAQADFIYISIPHINGEDQINPEIFRKDIEELRKTNLTMVCANPDQFAHEGKPPKAVVRQGSIASMYEKMGGQVYFIGKPHNKAFAIAMENFQKHKIADPSKILMVGDTPETDIRGARKFGMSAALVTETGMIAERINLHGKTALKNLSAQDSPNYLIGRLIDDL